MADDVLRAQVRQLFGRVAYTHKTHEKSREAFTRWAGTIKWVNIVLGGLTLGGAITALGTKTPVTLVASVLFATLNAAFALIQLSFDPQQQASLHREAAKRLLRIRDAYETLIADLKSGAIGGDEARRRRDDLQSRAQDIFATAPDTSAPSFRRARQALKADEELTFTTEEIDTLLPPALRDNPQRP